LALKRDVSCSPFLLVWTCFVSSPSPMDMIDQAFCTPWPDPLPTPKQPTNQHSRPAYLNSEDRCSMFLWNLGIIHPQDYMVQCSLSCLQGPATEPYPEPVRYMHTQT
jgi:hypothetical protein